MKGAHLVLSSCCKNLVAFGHTKNTLPSQWLLLDREENGLFYQIFEHDQGIFLDIGARYDPKNLWDLIGNFLNWENRGCFTMGQYCPEYKWNFVDKTLYWAMKCF